MAAAQTKQRRFRSVSLFWLIPNIITVAGLISGLTALRFALDGRWSMVIGLITLAAVFDALDGRAARRFRALLRRSRDDDGSTPSTRRGTDATAGECACM